MKKIILSSLVLTALLQAGPLGLVTHTEFGYIQNNGNTEDQTMTLDAKLVKKWDKHISTTAITGQYGTKAEIIIKNKWTFDTQYDYKFIDAFTFNYILGYKKDKFVSLEYQAYTGLGAKYIAFSSEKQNLNLSANILYSIDAKTDVDDKYIGYRTALDYSLQILENLKLKQELTYRNSFKDSQNYFLYSKTGFSSKISDIFSAGISYSYDYINLPGTDKDFDSVLTATLSIDY